MAEDKMVRQHHQLNGHEFEQIPGGNEGQGSLECCRPWGRKESDVTEQQQNIFCKNKEDILFLFIEKIKVESFKNKVK